MGLPYAPGEFRMPKSSSMSHFTHLSLPPRRRRRFTVVLPEATFSELCQLADGAGRTPAAVVQAALDLLKVARDETFRGNVLAIATRDGHLVSEIVIPG